MPGDDPDRGIAPPPRQALPDRGCRRDRRCQARHDRPAKAGAIQRLDLFIQPAENAAIAALEPHDAPPKLRLGHDQRIDVGLCRGRAEPLLAHIHQPRQRVRQRQHARSHQPVVNDHLGLLQGAQGAQGQVIRVARTGPDKGDLAGGCGRNGMGGKVEHGGRVRLYGDLRC